MKGRQIGKRVIRSLIQECDRRVIKPLRRVRPQKAGKRILCFGDRNTWGSNPSTGLRYGFNNRWPGVLQAELGKEVIVIEEGRSGRKTVLEDPYQSGCNEKPALEHCLQCYQPLDLVLVLLGTNDLKDSFNRSPVQIAEGVEELGRMALTCCQSSNEDAPILMRIAPPVIEGTTTLSESFQGAVARSVLLAEHYRSVADRLKYEFFDPGAIIHSSSVDGVH